MKEIRWISTPHDDEKEERCGWISRRKSTAQNKIASSVSTNLLNKTFYILIMGRSRRGGGGFGAARRPAPAPRRPAANPPARPASTSTPAPMQQQSGGGMLSGIGSTIAQGMAFGTGSAIAHRAVGAVAGAMGGGGGEGQQAAPVEMAGDQNFQQQQQMQGACSNDKQMFFECLQVNRGDQQACSFLYEQLQQCQMQQNTTQFG